MTNTLRLIIVGYELWAILVLATTFVYAQEVHTRVRTNGRTIPKTIVYAGEPGLSNQQQDNIILENRDRVQELDGEVGQLRSDVNDLKQMHLENRLTKLESTLDSIIMLVRGTAIGVGVMLMSSLLNSVIKFRKG